MQQLKLLCLYTCSTSMNMHLNSGCVSVSSLVVRCQSCPPSETDKEDLLVKRAKEFLYRHRNSLSGPVPMSKDRNTSLLAGSDRR